MTIMLLFKNLPIKRNFKIFSHPIIILVGFLLICTLTTTGLSSPISVDQNQLGRPNNHSSVHPLISNSELKTESVSSIDRSFTTDHILSASTAFHNVTFRSPSNIQTYPNKLVVDKTGNIYALGVIYNASSFNSYLYSSTSYTGLFLVKYAPNGTQLWNRTWGNAHDTSINILVDSSGFIYTLDYSSTIYNYSLNLYTTNLTLLKWDPAGNVVWNKIFLIYSSYYIYSTNLANMAIDQLNNVYVEYPAYPVQSVNGYYYGSTNTTVLKLDSGSNKLWNVTINATIYGLTTSYSNNLYLTGYSGTFKLFGTDGSLYWYNKNITATNIQVDNASYIYTLSNGGIQQWSPNQTLQWSLNYNNFTTFGYIYTIVLVNASNLYVVYQSSNTYALAQINSYGSVLWRYSINITSSSDIQDLIFGSNNNIYALQLVFSPSVRYLIIEQSLTGNTLKTIPWLIQPTMSILKSVDDSNGNVYALGTASYNTNYYGLFQSPILLKYNRNGTLLWSHTLWSSSTFFTSISAIDIGIDSTGNIYTVGNDPSNFILVKWSPAGIPLWNFSFNYFPDSNYPNIHTSGKYIQLGSADNVYVLASYTITSFNNNYISGLMLIKVNINGQRLWTKTFYAVTSTYQYSYFSNVVLLSNPHHEMYIVSDGLINPLSSGGTNLTLLHIDTTTGNIASNKTILLGKGINLILGISYNSLAVGDDGSLYIGYAKQVCNPSCNNASQIQDKPYFVKYDANGNQLWNKSWVTTANITVPVSMATDNVGYIYSLLISLPTNNNHATSIGTTLSVMNRDGNQVQDLSFNNVFGSSIFVDANRTVLITGNLYYNYSLYGYSQSNGQIILISNSFLVNAPAGDILSSIVNFITANAEVLSIFVLLGAVGGGIGLFYYSKNTLNVISKGTHPFNKNAQRMVPSQNYQRTTNIFAKKPPLQRPDPEAVNLIEQILTETYQAPDYATALKVQQGGFPDYTLYKQALEKGIITYKDWKEKYP